MRHRKLSSKLGRTSAHRRAMFRNLVTALLDHERVETSEAKARQLRRVADRMITLGKRGTLHARRRALRVVRSKQVTGKLFSDLAERYRERPGGYTRVVKARYRVGDAAPMSIVELVEGEVVAKPAATRRRRGAAAKPERRAKAEASAAETRRGRRSKARGTAAETPKKGAAKTSRRSRAKAETSEESERKKSSPARGRRRSKVDKSESPGRKKRS